MPNNSTWNITLDHPIFILSRKSMFKKKLLSKVLQSVLFINISSTIKIKIWKDLKDQRKNGH